MIVISGERCDGCGACVEVCPEGAIYLVDGRAMVDVALCRECEACIAACPMEAIAYTSREPAMQVEPARTPVPRPEPDVIRVRTRPAPIPSRARVLPLVGGALAWAGREIIPRLADYALDSLDRRAMEKRGARVLGSRPDRGFAARGRGGGGQHRRRRRRGS